MSSAVRTGERWDTVARAIERSAPMAGWRAQSDAVNAALLDRWLPSERYAAALKTDLFDEAFGQGLVEPLASRAETVFGIDVSAEVVERARRAHPSLQAQVADVRSLPFGDGEVDLIVSNSTLDHLGGRADVAGALGEIARVLAPGGRLVVTLDNPLNPFVAAREALPPRLSARLRRVPYDSGWTCGPRALTTLLTEAGLEPLEATAIVHAPRFLVARLGRLALATDGGAARWVRAFEVAERLPSRYLSGHFVAALASRPPAAQRMDH